MVGGLFPINIEDDEDYGDYEGMDISSLCRVNGIRDYFKILHKDYLKGGITLA